MVAVRALLATLSLQLPAMLEAGNPFASVHLPSTNHFVHAVQSVQEEVAKAAPIEALKSGIEGTKGAVDSLGSQAKEAIQPTLEDLHGATSREPGDLQQAAREAVEQAGEAASRAADAGASLAASAGVPPSVAAARVEMIDASGRVVDAARTKKSDLASRIREAAPQVAWHVNRTSLQVAGIMAQAGTQASLFLNRTGLGLAERIEGHQAAGGLDGVLQEAKDLAEQVPQEGWLGLSGAMVLVAIGCTMYTGVCVKTRVEAARAPPIVLRETLMDEVDNRGAGEARGPAFQPPQHVPLVEGP